MATKKDKGPATNGHVIDATQPDVARLLNDPAQYRKLQRAASKPARNGHSAPVPSETPKAPVTPAPARPLPDAFPDSERIFGSVGEKDNAAVEQLRALVDSVMSTDNMRLRSQISPQLAARLVPVAMFAAHYDSDAMRNVETFILEIRTSIKGWQMGNLIKALQALRAPYPYMDGEQSRGLKDKILGRH